MTDVRASFHGTIPEFYDKYLGPVWPDAFGADLVRRLPGKPADAVLEIAAGTGRVTRQLREHLDPSIRLVASDLSGGMVDYARGKLGGDGIEWLEADAMALPFDDGAFGAVVCAFGFMFVPDKPVAFAEARRVLKDDGLLLFTVWDRIEENRHAALARQVVDDLFPGDAEMQFTTPFDMHDVGQLRRWLTDAGFRDIRIETKRIAVGPISARAMATGSVRGTPRSHLYEARGVSLDEVIDRYAVALTGPEGGDAYSGSAQAIVVEARRSLP
jgi:ubiquinone/menaquinone biosynthesis C-methylase UbiE